MVRLGHICLMMQIGILEKYSRMFSLIYWYFGFSRSSNTLWLGGLAVQRPKPSVFDNLWTRNNNRIQIALKQTELALLCGCISYSRHPLDCHLHWVPRLFTLIWAKQASLTAATAIVIPAFNPSQKLVFVSPQSEYSLWGITGYTRIS